MSMTLTFPKFYTRTLFCFGIPEIAISNKSVHREFDKNKLYDKLKNYETVRPYFDDFGSLKPVFNFKEYDKEAYVDYFWLPYYQTLSISTAPHFPFEMFFKKKFERVMGEEDNSNGTSLKMKRYDSRILARLYPYGAISIQIIESVEPEQNCSSKQIVQFLDSPILLNSEKMPLKKFLNYIRENILRKIFKSEFVRQPIRSPYFIINPEISSLPDVNNSWSDIASLLSVSNEKRHMDKFPKSKYSSNYGHEDQMIMCSSRSALLFIPPLQKDATMKEIRKRLNAITCMSNRITNIAELVAIQESFANQLLPTFQALLTKNENTEGYPLAELIVFLKDRLGNNIGKQISGLTEILTSHQYLQTQKKWNEWDSAILKEKEEVFQNFINLLKNLRDRDVEIGSDNRDAIKYILEKVRGFLAVVPAGK